MSRSSHRHSRPLEHLFRATTQSGISNSRMINFEPSPNVQRLNMEHDGSLVQDKKPPSSINRIAAYERQHLPTGRRLVDTEAVDHCFGSDVDYLVGLDDCSSQ